METFLQKLNEAFPEARCELGYGSLFELLVAVILSAQCTDKRVNIVTNELFKVANTPKAINDMPIETLEGYIKTCGLYKSKAKNIKATAQAIVEKFGGEVPSDESDLLSLPGVGRKTANVVQAEWFNRPMLAVDTHVFRVAHRLGLSNGKTPDEVERDLCKVIQEEDRKTAHHALIIFGRYCCKAIKPDCENCPIPEFCKERGLHNGNKANTNKA